jgi:hypothetical protein
MNRTARLSAALLIVSLLAGCGAQAVTPPMAGATRSSASFGARAVIEGQADRLIADYKAVQGSDEAAIAKRLDLIDQLGASDSDHAVSFLESEYNKLDAYPLAQREAAAEAITDSLGALDTYDEAADEAIIKAGPGATEAQATAYAEAMARRSRHKGLMYWVQHPIKATGASLKKLWQFLTGSKPKPKKKRKPRPAPVDPAPIDPSAPY